MVEFSLDKLNLSLKSLYKAEACNELAMPIPATLQRQDNSTCGDVEAAKGLQCCGRLGRFVFFV